MEIRLLKADEIEVRVQTVKEKGYSLLLYKDARVDMRILDETFGVNGWQRTHEVINGNLFCNIDIYDDTKKCWIRKQDVGVESQTEKEKGRASDSFKRAGFNIGIGRELYTSPFIWVQAEPGETINDKGKFKLSPALKFSVKTIEFNDKKEIVGLEIADNKGKVRFSTKANKGTSQPDTSIGENKGANVPTDSQNGSEGNCERSEAQTKRLFAIAKNAGYTAAQVKSAAIKRFKKSELAKLTKQEYDTMCKGYEGVAK
ncbi:MAG: hypothetical protein K0S61_726 [Anaerocolumna sp.]|jgi:hypothetical protein|nr:hypothetical protein [Anaerocolumna sp.]